MLTAMTLALAHGHAAPPFNADFYTAAATIIPVLYLALAIQGPAYDALLKSYTDRFADAAALIHARNWRLPGYATRRAVIRAVIASVWAPTGAFIILSFGVYGEGQAVISLYARRAEGSPSDVLTSLLVMILAAAAGPAGKLARTIRQADRAAVAAADRAGRGPKTGPGTAPGEVAPP